MFQQLAARVARPFVGSTTAAAAAAAATAAASSASDPALADAAIHDPPSQQLQAALGEASGSKQLTVFCGGNDNSGNHDGNAGGVLEASAGSEPQPVSSAANDTSESPDEAETDRMSEEHHVWSLVESCGDITEEEVRVAAQPALHRIRSPPSDDDSDGTEAESVMQRAEDTMVANLTALLNDAAFQDFARRHIVSTGPPRFLLPALAAPLATPGSGCTIEELDDHDENAGAKSYTEQLAEGLKSVRDRFGKAWGGVGSMFQGAVDPPRPVTGRTHTDAGESSSTDDDYEMAKAIFAVAVLILAAVAAKRVAANRRDNK